MGDEDEDDGFVTAMLQYLEVPESLRDVTDEMWGRNESDPYGGQATGASGDTGTSGVRDNDDRHPVTSGQSDPAYTSSVLSAYGPGASSGGTGLLSSLGKWVGDNKELSAIVAGGIAGANKDKNAKEIAGMQIDYLKEKQAAMNNSIKGYGKTIGQVRG